MALYVRYFQACLRLINPLRKPQGNNKMRKFSARGCRCCCAILDINFLGLNEMMLPTETAKNTLFLQSFVKMNEFRSNHVRFDLMQTCSSELLERSRTSLLAASLVPDVRLACVINGFWRGGVFITELLTPRT